MPFSMGISNNYFNLALSKSTIPICAIFRPVAELQDLCQMILQGHMSRNTQRTLNIFQIKCPLLFDSFAEIDNPTLFSRMQDLLRKLLQSSGAPFRVTGSPVDSLGPKSNAIVESLTYLPCLPRVRVQVCYQVDRVRSTFEVIYNKKAGRQLRLVQGIILVHCAHGM